MSGHAARRPHRLENSGVRMEPCETESAWICENRLDESHLSCLAKPTRLSGIQAYSSISTLPADAAAKHRRMLFVLAIGTVFIPCWKPSQLLSRIPVTRMQVMAKRGQPSSAASIDAHCTPGRAKRSLGHGLRWKHGLLTGQSYAALSGFDLSGPGSERNGA